MSTTEIQTDKKRISYSQMSSYKRCKRKWYYRYIKKLEPIQTPRPLSIGKFVHKGMECYYADKDWRVGMEEMHQANLLALDKAPNSLEEIEHYKREAYVHYEDAIGIFERYLVHDKIDPLLPQGWKILSIEEEFLADLPDVEDQLYGFIDMVVEDEFGNIWGIEHKTGEQFFDVEQLTLDEQASIYTMILRAKYGDRAQGLIYNLVRTKRPSVPKMTRTGAMSKAAIDTTWEIYSQALTDNGLDISKYEDMQAKLEDNKFFTRDYIYRTNSEINNFITDVSNTVEDVVNQDPNKCYRSANRNCQWDCKAYNQLCVMDLKGLDTDYYVGMTFKEKSSDREILVQE